MEHARKISPLARLFRALEEKGIRTQIAGMSAAILRGVPATTLDTDIWIDLPERQYVKVLDGVRQQSGSILPRTVVAKDDSLVNFLYRVDGLGSFAEEFPAAKKVLLGGWKIAVLSLDRIIASKRVVGRPKDLAHLPLLEQVAGIKRMRKKR